MYGATIFPGPTPARVEEVIPRVVELSDGFGLPGLVLAVIDPTRTIEVVEPDLEDVFLHLTGKALRD